MIRLFGRKPEHPLADPIEARRILGALPEDGFQALEELEHWLESAGAAETLRPEARVQALFAVDEAAQPRLRRLSREYFASERTSRFQENRLWLALHGYYRQAGASFARAVDLFVQGVKTGGEARALLPALLVRALRNLGQHLKWMHLRYGPIDPGTWAALNGVYAFAEARGLAHARAAPYPAVPGESTPQLEFLRAGMFSAAAPDCLRPAEAELAERLIATFAPKFAIAATPAPWFPFWTDLGKAMAPARSGRGEGMSAGTRWFGAGAALAELEALVGRMEAGGAVPSDLAGASGTDAEVLLGVLRHLARAWSPLPSERGSRRHAVKSRVAVIHGFDGVRSALGKGGAPALEDAGAESWVVENVSAGGFGAAVPQPKGDWLRVGALVALQPEGGANWVLGVVRRVNRTSAREARVGIETLARAAEVLRFDAGGVAEEGILIREGSAGSARILLAPGVYAPQQNLESRREGRLHLYLPQGIAERGEDYDLVRYREMVRES